MTKRILYLLLLFMLAPTVFAQNVEGTYKGDYSIEYLIKNYNVVTFGQKDNNLSDYLKSLVKASKGSIKDVTNIEGPILVNGDYTSSDDATYGTKDSSYESYIKGNVGNNVTTTAKRVTTSNYVDFKKMYQQVINEQQKLVDDTEYKINDYQIKIDKPGIYTITNAQQYGRWDAKTNIAIKNYDKYKLYVFNVMKLIELQGFDILIENENGTDYIPITEYMQNNEYSGNIIINYPNAIFMNILISCPVNIIAPKADITLSNVSYGNYQNGATGAILANSITGYNAVITYYPYSSNKTIVKNAPEITEPEDYKDDLYTGSYSLDEMLKNYSVVTLGQKNYEKNTIFYKTGGYKKGSAKIFHIAGQFLVNGDLNSQRQDLESNYATESAIGGNCRECNSFGYFKFWKYDQNYDGTWGTLSNVYQKGTEEIYQSKALQVKKDFINFKRLYEKVVEEQQMLSDGETIEPKETLHIKIGSNYVIDDISNVKEIVLDGFDENKNEATYITIMNEGNITMPKVMAEDAKNGYITTNDYMGKESATYQYEQYSFGPDHYFGNVVWNVPNANYIELTEDAPFAGHLIAPNADVETPELHFSGCFVVNSLYTAGNTEAHFYPMTAGDVLGTFLENQMKINNPEPEPETSDENQKNPETSTGAIVAIVVFLLILSIIGIIKLRNPKHEKIG